MMKHQIIRLLVLVGLFLSMSGMAIAQQDNSHDHQAKDEHQDNDHDGKKEDEHAHAEKQDEHGSHAEKQDEHGSHAEKQDDGHGHGDESEEEAEGVMLSSQQTTLANIEVEALNARAMNFQVYAPGEIKSNGYTSYLVSPRVDSVVLRRHASLGDHVEKGMPLVTLFSEQVAEAQAILRVSRSEWHRVEKLGRKAVGDKRFVIAQTDYQTAYSRLLAFGLSDTAIQSFAKKPQALGEYTLIAVIDGAVLSDDFHQGQRVGAGEALMELADESQLWIEARLSPTTQLQLPAGTPAKVKVGEIWFAAKVTQEAHTIDPQTRTRVVRLLINNKEHRLHPGLFADVYFTFVTKEKVLAVPETALMRGADGDWMVFVEIKTEQFKAQEVELGRSFGQWREIMGLPSGSRIVMKGAFFVASEIAKGGFDPHNH